jgi:ribosomal protein S18 acetylase RimI-like enzyme
MKTLTISIREYEPADQTFFEQLYRSWFTGHFRMQPEPIDEYVLSRPEEAVLSHGGAILIAFVGEEPAGSVALKKVDHATQELTKMGVRENSRGKGVGEALARAAISKALELNAKRIVLYTHSSLGAALFLYRKLGFKEVSLEQGTYSHTRCNLKMELSLEDADHH